MGLIKKVSKKKYRSSKTFKKQMEAVNKRLGKFKLNNVTANNVRLFNNLIKSFNKKYKLGEDNVFNTKLWYTKEQQKEIRDIIKAVYADPETSLRYWSDTYKKVKEGDFNKDTEVNLNFFSKINEKFEFEDVQDFIEWSDTMNRFRSSDIIGKILDSEQYYDLVNLADETGYSDEFDIDELIINEFNKTGKRFVSLYNHVFDILMNYEKYGTTNVEEE